MTLTAEKWRNPDLEAIRNSVTGPPNIDAVIEDLTRKTKYIHVSFLFGPEGKRALRELCLSLSSTTQSLLYSGWEDFGYHLGLDPQLVKLFSNCYNDQDPTFNIFRAYAQEEDSTLSNVIEALKKTDRVDVINKAYDLLNSLADEVHRKYGNSEESGYLSLSGGSVESSNECSEDGIQQAIIKSPYVPNVPFLYKKNADLVQARDVTFNSYLIENQQKERAPSETTVEKSEVNHKHDYGLKVMLTYASDGAKEAEELARVMRAERCGLPRIGVLILQEQMEHVNRDPQQFIAGAFHQVDYVIPIITEQYLKSATSVKNNFESSIDCIDANYVRYIYTLMNTYFVANGCLNNKFRCIIPDKLLQSVIRHPLMTGPLFQVWIKLSEAESLSRRLLQAKLRRK